MRNKFKLHIVLLVAVVIVGVSLGYASFTTGSLMQEIPIIKTLTKMSENNELSNSSGSQNSQGNQDNQYQTTSNNGGGDNFTQNSNQIQIIEKKPIFTVIMTCKNCQGIGNVPCTNPECENGIMKWSWRPGSPGHGISVLCEVCKGTGKLTCPVCKGTGKMELKVRNIIDPDKISR